MTETEEERKKRMKKLEDEVNASLESCEECSSGIDGSHHLIE
jgi:hypothetical protein